MTNYAKFPDLSTVPTSPAHNPGVRVRFCPSPTGTPRVGMVRACLFNWAHARFQGDTFVFRIEDTDVARDSEESLSQIIDSLTWPGLDWDEGVGKGGPYGPCRQSERTGMYREVAGQLLEVGHTYESFSTPERIQAHHVATGRDPKPGHDGSDRDMTAAQRGEYIRQGHKPMLCLRMPDEDITFTDLVRGEVTPRAGSVPDYVIVHVDKNPLHPLVNPIDDALMEITHILHGEGILSSTPRQIALHRALHALGIAKSVPYFEHLPCMMGEGSKKFSKCNPESNPLLHRQHGIILKGLANYLVLLGWSIAPDRNIFSLPEMTVTLDIKDVNPNPTRFDQKRCDAIDTEHTRLLDTNDFMRRLVSFSAETRTVPGGNFEALIAEEQCLVTAAAPLAQIRVMQLNQIMDLIGFLFGSRVSYNDKTVGELKDSASVALSGAASILEAAAAGAWGGTEAIHQVLNEALISGLELKPREASAPLLVAATGTNVPIPVLGSMRVLRREETLYRLANFCVRYCTPNGN